MKDDNQKRQKPKQEIELEDLPVEDSKQDEVKGGPGAGIAGHFE